MEAYVGDSVYEHIHKNIFEVIQLIFNPHKNAYKFNKICSALRSSKLAFCKI